MLEREGNGVISQEQWDAIRARFMDDYRDYVDSNKNGSGYKPALDKALEDIQLLLMAAKPVQRLILVETGGANHWVGTCIKCKYGVCKIKGSHT